jgi:hypothetical protein
VQYHNDLHAADVAQMFYLFIKDGNLATVAKLNYLDLLSAITASACHDYNHDGLNNTYHVNFMTDRALRYHDKAVQENWHASESMKLLLKEENNFMGSFSVDEKKVFRKRIVGMILATDMADHMSHQNVIKYKISNKHITIEAGNGHAMIDASNDKEMFQSQQHLLDFLIHSADLSTPTRPFDTLKRWTYELFDEFFDQGDIEKANSMPASFLCDRETTVVCKEQPGFLNFIVLPIWEMVAIIMPPMEVAKNRAQENVVMWQNYEETDEDRKVYQTKTKLKKKSMNYLDTLDIQGFQEPGSSSGNSHSAASKSNEAKTEPVGVEESKQRP